MTTLTFQFSGIPKVAAEDYTCQLRTVPIPTETEIVIDNHGVH